MSNASIQELDYHPNHIARSLKSKHTTTLGMVISDITNPFFPLVVRGAEDAASEQGYSLITFNTDDRVDRERPGFVPAPVAPRGWPAAGGGAKRRRQQPHRCRDR